MRSLGSLAAFAPESVGEVQTFGPLVTPNSAFLEAPQSSGMVF